MSGDAIITVVILAVTVALLVSDRLRLDVVAMLSLVSLALAGVVPVDVALAGFANPTVLMLAGLMACAPVLACDGPATVCERMTPGDFTLLRQGVPAAVLVDADADSAIFVMDRHGDDGALEARIGHAGHGQQQAAGQEGRRRLHDWQNAPRAKMGQPLSA